MSRIIDIAKNIFTKFCQQGIADRANFLKNIAVAGWILSSAAQTTAVIFNDKIPKKEKKFLIPQEIFDGVINCTLFWFITSKFTNIGKKLILNKHIIPKDIAKIIKNFKTPKGKIDDVKTAFLTHVKNLGSASDARKTENAIEGMGIFAGIVGSILSNNICTPIIRNKLASYYQQKEIANEKNMPKLNENFGNIDYKKYSFNNLTPAPRVNSFRGFYSNQSLKI